MLDHRRLKLSVRPGVGGAKRAEVMYEWHKRLLYVVVADTAARCEPRSGEKGEGYFLQCVKAKCGSCKHAAGNIRLNTELVKKPMDLVEQVMVRLLVLTHSDKFVRMLTWHWPHWQELRRDLNELPMATEESTA